MAVETELGLPQLETTTCIAFIPDVSVPGISVDILQQFIGKASGAAKNRTSNL